MGLVPGRSRFSSVLARRQSGGCNRAALETEGEVTVAEAEGEVTVAEVGVQREAGNEAGLQRDHRGCR
jgi:hypothetical protein